MLRKLQIQESARGGLNWWKWVGLWTQVNAEQRNLVDKALFGVCVDKDIQTLIQALVSKLGEHGFSVDVHIRLGAEPEIETDTIVSDLGAQPATHQETDLHFGFSSPAGQQFWDDDELKGKR